ncbi:MAG: hypothetical protein GFH27_549303n51 [Chloroflexi bacterium AL-W]|nr:hypothetical protein [Chloroflexi bacterium AL-N1]NOK67936.1 hypothetical protein [Chloroflexi bacterium AL-N10]NOK73276.1 hypothetical protein [Chloroflexi bacterium AL-N5]NOK83190.1 hypothetical protein [Chloroflexi bacterium AL-W]NOK87607.1 hypothetical protein [Chloroflexi bacterium AL-N15]
MVSNKNEVYRSMSQKRRYGFLIIVLVMFVLVGCAGPEAVQEAAAETQDIANALQTAYGTSSEVEVQLSEGTNGSRIAVRMPSTTVELDSAEAAVQARDIAQTVLREYAEPERVEEVVVELLQERVDGAVEQTESQSYNFSPDELTSGS